MPCISLPDRLKAIAELVPKNSVTADIGTDHALLPIHLIQKGITGSVIASDIVDGPLESAKKNITAHGLADKITLIKSDGLTNVFPLSPKTIIIAGMGGETIRDILADCDYCIKASPYLLLQPMTHTELLRQYLIENGYSILHETVIQQQHRFYVIISTQHKQEQKHYFDDNSLPKELLCELGGITCHTCAAAKNYLLWRRETAERAMQGLLKSENFRGRAEEFSELIAEIDRRLSVERIGE